MSHRTSHLPPHLEGQSSWLSKATSARFLGHPLVWSGMTGLFIFAGYLWLQNYARPLSDQLGELHTDSELVGAKNRTAWNPDIYRGTETKEKMPITHQADLVRAEKYREMIDIENQIQPLLSQARSYMENEIYTGNGDNNAWHSYQQILDIEAAHKLAESGQAQILGLLQSNAEYATDEFEYEEAELWLAELDTIEPENPFQAGLRQRIAEQISEEVTALEAKSRKARTKELLKDALQDAGDAMQVSPPRLRVAYDLYIRALELDEKNKSALKGLKAIQSARISYTKQAITDKNFTEARSQIDRLQQIGVEEKSVKELESALAEAKVMPEINSPPVSANPVKAAPSTSTPTESVSDKKSPPLPDTEPALKNGIETIEIESNSDTPLSTEASLSRKSQQLAEGITAYYSGNYNSAFDRLHPLAEANSSRAQFRVGIMYYQGRTVVKNEDVARQWIARALPAILRSAQKGVAWAQADLGTAYELGIGVKQDMTRAASLYRKSAKQGYAGAQTNLGVLYGTGTGLKYDRKLAIYWLKKAALQGDKIAQDNLIILNAR